MINCYLNADYPAIFFFSGQAKSKKAKATKPVEDPPVLASEPARPPSPLTVAPEDPTIVHEANPPEPSLVKTTINPSVAGPSSSTDPPSPRVQDVQITGSRYVEPGNPTVLARWIAKQEALERRKVRLDVANYDRLNASDILSGYLSHVHSSRDSEIEMVKQLQLKYEVCSFRFTNIPSAPKSVDYERNRITYRLTI